MNRQQFLAEFTQYLTFTTAQEREAIIAHYISMFDSTGTEGENALLAELGTPMKVAIELKRKKESGEDLLTVCPMPQGDEQQTEEPVQCQTEAAEAAEEQPDTEGEDVQEPEAASDVLLPNEPEEEKAEEPESSELSEEAEEIAEDDIEVAQLDSRQAEEAELPGAQCSGKKPNSGGRVFAIIGSVLLSLIIAAAALAVVAVGVFGVCTMGNLVTAGLQNLELPENALLLFGGGLVIGAVALLLIWLAIRSAVSLIAKLKNRLCACEKKADGGAKIRKILWIILIVLCAAGIICAAIGVVMGGSLQQLQENQPARDALYGLTWEYIVGLISSFIGA